jgi:hypothetical protein
LTPAHFGRSFYSEKGRVYNNVNAKRLWKPIVHIAIENNKPTPANEKKLKTAMILTHFAFLPKHRTSQNYNLQLFQKAKLAMA